MVEKCCVLGLIVMENTHGIKSTPKKIEGFKKVFFWFAENLEKSIFGLGYIITSWRKNIDVVSNHVCEKDQ